MLPPLRLLVCVGVVGESFSCFLNERLSLRLCPVGAGGAAVGISSALLVLVGDARGVEEAIVPLSPVLEVANEFFCGRVTGLFFAATAMAGLCGEPMAMTKGMAVLDEALSLRSGRDIDG